MPFIETYYFIPGGRRYYFGLEFQGDRQFKIEFSINGGNSVTATIYGNGIGTIVKETYIGSDYSNIVDTSRRLKPDYGSDAAKSLFDKYYGRIKIFDDGKLYYCSSFRYTKTIDGDENVYAVINNGNTETDITLNRFMELEDYGG